MNYHDFRHFADSWGLLAMTVTFLTFVGWTFRRGASQRHDEAARMIFDEDQNNG